jgi:NAD-dependent deacetylase
MKGVLIMTPPEHLIDPLSRVHTVAAFCGAGISAESGVPTFRDVQTGLWAQFRPEDLATPQAYLNDPKLVWDWYWMRHQRLTSVAPNPGHLALAQLDTFTQTTIITQNVDGLHHRAKSRQILELHGTLAHWKCFDAHHRFQGDPMGLPQHRGVPLCPVSGCGSTLRPDVVWFGESLPEGVWAQAYQVSQEVQLFLSVGTSALVQPAASLPLIAKKAGAIVIEINPQTTPLTSQVHWSLQEKAGLALPWLVQWLKDHQIQA